MSIARCSFGLLKEHFLDNMAGLRTSIRRLVRIDSLKGHFMSDMVEGSGSRDGLNGHVPAELLGAMRLKWLHSLFIIEGHNIKLLLMTAGLFK